MLNAARKLTAAATTLWRGTRMTDRAEVRRKVAALRRQYPDVSRDELFRTLVYGKCVQVGAVGAMTAAIERVPGMRSLGGALLGFVADEAMVTSLQSELVAEVFALYDVDLPADFERVVIASIAAGHLGAHAATGSVARQVAHHAQRWLGGALSRAALPVAAIATSAAGHIAITYAIGARAKAVARMRSAGIREWPDLLREFAMLDERKLTAWATTATRVAITQAGTAAQSWMRQLGAMMPAMPVFGGGAKKQKASARKPASLKPRATPKAPAGDATAGRGAKRPAATRARRSTTAAPKPATRRSTPTGATPTRRRPRTTPSKTREP